MFIDTRSEFIFKDPDALDALLQYDWRVRKVLTDQEVVGTSGRAGAVLGADGSSSILRHMQRVNCIKAVHGVRRQGGRMRLWRMEEVLKLQIALDLREATGLKLSACVDIFDGAAQDDITAVIAGWTCHIGETPSVASKRPARFDPALINDRERLLSLVKKSVREFVARNGFDAVQMPAFLL
ncbi:MULTISPECIES: hypothetical protein [Marinicauda]|uniref:hypothetical protein n=1 Tax=Marinicauda TaxID=1649466 RepID=UPI0022E193E2|nr:hypothetical protein [Marinicauda sp. Alg238-R41]